jgi:hypothetical protein
VEKGFKQRYVIDYGKRLAPETIRCVGCGVLEDEVYIRQPPI